MEATRIEEVVGEFVSLKKRGVNLLGLCPFHNEKTPSFTVSAAKGIFKCFGCGKAGNAVGFLMEHEHFSYPEALKYLARKYNIEVEEEAFSEEERQFQDERDALMTVSLFAQRYYTRLLHESDMGKSVGLSYFKERGFRGETIEKFQLGYASEEWSAFTEEALGEGYKLEYLEKTGLTILKEQKKYDRFRGRVMFPIHNLSGKIIGFGGRILSNDKNKPKYLNSPESVIYNKSKVLYGIYFARTEMVRQDNCYLVEGYTDVLSLHQAGITNVVASSGTSLTTDQIKLIKRYTPNITILYDGDTAGIKASFRGIDMILEEGMNVRIVLFPDGEDPDSYARSHRTSELEAYITQEAKDFILFKTAILQKDAGNDPIRKSALIRDIVTSVSLIPDRITRSVYVKECSTLLDIPEQTLVTEINKLYRKKFTGKYGKGIPDPVEPPKSPSLLKKEEDILTVGEDQERALLRLLLLFPETQITLAQEDPEEEEGEPEQIDVASFILTEIANDELKFENTLYQAIYDLVLERLEQGMFTSGEYLINYTDPAISQAVIDMITTPHNLSENWAKNQIFIKKEEDILAEAVLRSMLSFKSSKVNQELTQLLKALKETTDEEQNLAMMDRIKALQAIQKRINTRLGRTLIG
ncbi:MAG: DNA primase [Bacteroidetes bacterium]|nr:MAG: DNA primase [Bacteroidota bacterium]